MRLLGNRHDAEEICQEAFLQAFCKAAGFKGRSHFYTWVYRIMIHLCYRRLKSGRKETSVDAIEVADPSASAREQAAASETISLVRRALCRLKPADFEILVLREFEELSYEELAQRLRLPHGTVMSRLHRARLALAVQLEKLGVCDS